MVLRFPIPPHSHANQTFGPIPIIFQYRHSHSLQSHSHSRLPYINDYVAN